MNGFLRPCWRFLLFKVYRGLFSNKSSPAWPYIIRLMVFNRFICPSSTLYCCMGEEKRVCLQIAAFFTYKKSAQTLPIRIKWLFCIRKLTVQPSKKTIIISLVYSFPIFLHHFIAGTNRWMSFWALLQIDFHFFWKSMIRKPYPISQLFSWDTMFQHRWIILLSIPSNRFYGGSYRRKRAGTSFFVWLRRESMDDTVWPWISNSMTRPKKRKWMFFFFTGESVAGWSSQDIFSPFSDPAPIHSRA